MTRWERTISAIKDTIPGFAVDFKANHVFHRVLTRLVCWTDYTKYVTTWYPKVFFKSEEEIQVSRPWWVLQHEWVHLLDAKTLFGLLPKGPIRLNVYLFSLLYLFPQILALLGFLGFVNPWWFLAFMCALPLPSPTRAWIELRAYRRSVELGDSVTAIADEFTGPSYYFMWPFRRRVAHLLHKPSPYRDLMDGTTSLPGK